MLALVLAGLLVVGVPAAWVLPLLVLVHVEVVTAGVCRLRDEDRDFDTELELEDDGLRPPPVIVLKKLFNVFT